MSGESSEISLRKRLQEKEQEVALLREQLAALQQTAIPPSAHPAVQPSAEENKKKLSHGEVARYSRQLILPELGVPGQLLLVEASVLVVGCGGLGCPAALYLAAAGLGTIGLLDYDQVEMSNLHRQVLHSETKVGRPKVESAAAALAQLNSCVNVVQHNVVLDSKTALDIIQKYDIVLDCTDNVATRYLLNDACVLSKKPLISGAALRWDGQLTIYNYLDGPCYRCLYPTPPPPETVTNCSDGGVMGVIPGIVGSMQALEAIKIIANIGPSSSRAMLLFDGFTSTFQKVKLRAKQESCTMCGDDATIRALIDYEQFCGAAAADKDAEVHLLSDEQRLSVEAYRQLLTDETRHVLLDVRQPVELGICSLPGALNVPLSEVGRPDGLLQIRQAMEVKQASLLVCLCRRGNDSQRAAHALSKLLDDCVVQDIAGGLTQWARKIDNSMPIY